MPWLLLTLWTTDGPSISSRPLVHVGVYSVVSLFIPLLFFTAILHLQSALGRRLRIKGIYKKSCLSLFGLMHLHCIRNGKADSNVIGVCFFLCVYFVSFRGALSDLERQGDCLERI